MVKGVKLNKNHFSINSKKLNTKKLIFA